MRGQYVCRPAPTRHRQDCQPGIRRLQYLSWYSSADLHFSSVCLFWLMCGSVATAVRWQARQVVGRCLGRESAGCLRRSLGWQAQQKRESNTDTRTCCYVEMAYLSHSRTFRGLSNRLTHSFSEKSYLPRVVSHLSKTYSSKIIYRLLILSAQGPPGDKFNCNTCSIVQTEHARTFSRSQICFKLNVLHHDA